VTVIRVRVSREVTLGLVLGLGLGFRVRVMRWTGNASAQLLGPIGGPLCTATTQMLQANKPGGGDVVFNVSHITVYIDM